MADTPFWNLTELLAKGFPAYLPFAVVLYFALANEMPHRLARAASVLAMGPILAGIGGVLALGFTGLVMIPDVVLRGRGIEAFKDLLWHLVNFACLAGVGIGWVHLMGRLNAAATKNR